MTQSIIVYIILVIAIAYSVYAIVKNIRKKEKSPCDGCDGCDLKKELRKNIKNKTTKNPDTCLCAIRKKDD